MGKVAEMVIQTLREGSLKMEIQELLSTPVRDLKRPLPIKSLILDGEMIFLCATQEMAEEVEAKGGVAYLPEEISILSRKSSIMDQKELEDLLKRLHAAKKIFLGSRIQA
jgi:hypothetical protein